VCRDFAGLFDPRRTTGVANTRCDADGVEGGFFELLFTCHVNHEAIGMPEARIILGHATIYLATAPKSNRAYKAIDAALEDVKLGRTLPVPMHLRDGHYKGAKNLGNGDGYLYPHDFEGGFVPQRCLEGGRQYYEPTTHGLEGRIKERLDFFRQQWEKAKQDTAK